MRQLDRIPAVFTKQVLTALGSAAELEAEAGEAARAVLVRIFTILGEDLPLGPLSREEEIALNVMKRLMPAEFDELIARLRIPLNELPGGVASQSQKAEGVIHCMRRIEYGIESLASTLESRFPQIFGASSAKFELDGIGLRIRGTEPTSENTSRDSSEEISLALNSFLDELRKLRAECVEYIIARSGVDISPLDGQALIMRIIGFLATYRRYEDWQSHLRGWIDELS